jgi:hypothetical protein
MGTPMKVKELISLLHTMPENALVITAPYSRGARADYDLVQQVELQDIEDYHVTTPAGVVCMEEGTQGVYIE